MKNEIIDRIGFLFLVIGIWLVLPVNIRKPVEIFSQLLTRAQLFMRGDPHSRSPLWFTLSDKFTSSKAKLVGIVFITIAVLLFEIAI